MKGIRQTHNINEARGKRQTQQQKKKKPEITGPEVTKLAKQEGEETLWAFH